LPERAFVEDDAADAAIEKVAGTGIAVERVSRILDALGVNLRSHFELPLGLRDDHMPRPNG
jgi:hypothetical protein